MGDLMVLVTVARELPITCDDAARGSQGAQGIAPGLRERQR
jgi:hypothetical protein